MTDRELESRLKDALDHTAPDDIDDIFARCAAGKGTVIDIKQIPARRTRRWVGLIAACLTLVLLGGIGGGLSYRQAHTVTSVISLDVNPSIELKVNKNEKVLSCVGLNAESTAVLADMDGGRALIGAKLDTAVNAVVDALMRRGYLDNISSAILISVEDNDTDRSERIQQALAVTVGGTLQDAANQVTVLTQTITANAGLDAQAQQNNISSGKAYLVDQVVSMNEDLKFEELAPLSVEELRDMRNTGATGMPIGKDAALNAALAGMGLTAGDCSFSGVDPELDGSVPAYRVKLLAGDQVYNVAVDAYTGEILQSLADTAADGGDHDDPDADAEVSPAPEQSPEPEQSPAPEQSPEPEQSPAPEHMQIPAVSEAPVVTAAPSADIGEDAAKTVALSHAGVTAERASSLDVKRGYNGDRLEYEIRFTGNGYEYGYTIDAATGSILKQESKLIRGNSAAQPDPSAGSDPSEEAGGSEASGEPGSSGESMGPSVPDDGIIDEPAWETFPAPGASGGIPLDQSSGELIVPATSGEPGTAAGPDVTAEPEATDVPDLEVPKN